jgi:hypothetical protein
MLREHAAEKGPERLTAAAPLDSRSLRLSPGRSGPHLTDECSPRHGPCASALPTLLTVPAVAAMDVLFNGIGDGAAVRAASITWFLWIGLLAWRLMRLADGDGHIGKGGVPRTWRRGSTRADLSGSQQSCDYPRLRSSWSSGLNSFQCPSETTSTVPSVTLIAVSSSIA